MSNFRFGPRGHAFFSQFFKPVAGLTPDPAVYFAETFVPPSDFEDVVATIRPNLDQAERKLVIIDGQSRVGKTWTAIGAIARLLDENENLTWWTAGADSYRVFEGSDKDDDGLPRAPCDDILEGLRRVCQALAERQANLVLLDDFFGTVRLRPLASKREDFTPVVTIKDDGLERTVPLEIDEYLDWKYPHNRLRDALSKSGGTLVLTNRSVILTAAAVHLALPLRKSEPHELTPKRIARGFFRDEEGGLIGAFNEENLQEIYERNKVFITQHPNYRYPHVIAFIDGISNKIKKNPRTAEALFGADLDELALEILELEGIAASRSPAENGKSEETRSDYRDENKLQFFRNAYLLAIGPGLIFPGPSFYKALMIEEHATDLIEGLYLHPEGSSRKPGRVPNEYYITALKDHLSNGINLGLAARTLSYAFNGRAERGPLSGVQKNNLKICIRGLLERLIDRVPATRRLRKGDLPPDLAELINVYGDPLFDWEMQNPPEGEHGYIVSKPGFAASLGWALSHFKGLRERAAVDAVDWFLEHLRSQLADLEKIESPDIKKRNLIIASYSTFLQWAIKIAIDTGKGEILRDVASLKQRDNHELADRLLIVLYDELLWAMTQWLGSQARGLKDATNLFEALENDLSINEDRRKMIVANRLFSLCWHNEWLGWAAESEQRARLEKWLDRNRENALRAIKSNPQILDANLQYHWWHFITQYGDWMRNWCFHDDPLKYERDRIASGSDVHEHNEELLNIVDLILQPADDWDRVAQRLKNVLMLLGTRTSRLPNEGSLEDRVDAFLESCGDHRNALEDAILHAIFELARQGFLDSTSRDTTSKFREWCIGKVNRSTRREEVWREYRDNELGAVTHLDLLPENWDDIKPKS